MTGRGVAQDTSGVRANAVLSGQVAVVTGATKGLGLAIAREFLNSGASVMIASRREAAVNETVASLGAACGDLARVRGMAADVADLAQVEALGKAANGWHGHLDVWVNNAGITAPYGPSMALHPHAFTGVVHTNVLGTYHGSLVALRYLVPRLQGRLINILGRGDRQVVPYLATYGASKAWVRAFTLALASEYRATGVGIHAFNPGLMRTDFMTETEAITGFGSKLRALRVVLRLIGTDPEVPARTVVWLASRATEGKTGLEKAVFGRLGLMGHSAREGIAWLRGKVGPVELKIREVPASGPSAPPPG
ncbi:MAG: SDR family oxidoreductase [Proteobacteria bacterium]|nr:SDR family oxidoreductase [Pseudomonadota bacterium]